MSELSELVIKFNQLVDSGKLERDRAEEVLINRTYSVEEADVVVTWIQTKILDQTTLDKCLGSLTACRILLSVVENIPNEFLQFLSIEFLKFHSHDEYRVRILAGECMGLLCRLRGIPQFNEYIDIVKDNIKKNMKERQELPSVDLIEKLKDENVFHDAAGWKSLETWMKCFEFIVNGLGTRFEEVVDEDMFCVLFVALRHPNLFVRESGFDLIGTIAERHGCAASASIYLNICNEIGHGLTDNWSQVRMSASVACRKFLASKRPQSVEQSVVFAELLPRICLNRYYLAEGVRLYNQQTWRITVGENGPSLLEQHLNCTVTFYIEETDSDNHSVREAACTCISELIIKLSQDAVRPFVARMLDALVVCLNDDSWPVRDVAGVACGRMAAAFPSETKQYRDDMFVPLLLNNVFDSIQPVREGGALALALAVSSILDISGGDQMTTIIQTIIEHLQSVKDQKEESRSPTGFERNSPAVFSIVKGILGGEELSDGKQMNYPSVCCCGFRSPTVRKARAKSDSYESIFIRKGEPWEKADGCIMLLGELLQHCKQSHSHSGTLISSMITACGYKHYPHYVYLLTTACKTISKIYDSIGKQNFKKYLNDILSLIDAALCCDCPLAKSSAEESIRYLIANIGANVMRGRLEMYSMDLLDRTQHLFH